ncbi:MAG: guanylate kinase [Eubacterium sp.]|nr:guanylate kinase [Eubacterium sp.]
MARGKLLVISGFSGVGKGKTVETLLEKYDNYKISVSATTRDPRENESHGKHYFFVDQDTFKKMIADDELLEYANYVGNYYGTPRKYVEEQLEAGYNVILEIESEGAKQVKEKMPDTIMVFLLPPSAAVLHERLTGRQTESDEVIKNRLEKSVMEIDAMQYYDYFIINDDIDVCAADVNKVVEGLEVSLPEGIKVEEITNDIKKFQEEN